MDVRRSVFASMEAAVMGSLVNVDAPLDILGPVVKRNAQKEGGVQVVWRRAPVHREQLATMLLGSVCPVHLACGGRGAKRSVVVTQRAPNYVDTRMGAVSAKETGLA